jgi:threonine dehydrogenase-like Zn-dependent dehydrogenase
MKALQFINSQVVVSDVPAPSVELESLIRVTRSGICNTDIEIIKGYAGFSGTIGHEFVGIVERSADSKWIGKRVVGEINAGCGVCDVCLNADARHCPNRTVLGIHQRPGAHAEFVSLPEVNLLEVPENVSDEEAVFTEPLAAAYGILEQVTIEPETRVAVIGDGKLGILCAQAMGLASRNAFLVGKHKEKMRVAELQGIEGVLLADAPKLNGTFDVVVEASGSESGFATALDLLKPRGKLVLKSTFNGRTAIEMSRVVVDEISIIGSRCGRFAPALELLRDGKVDVLSFISEEFALADGVRAITRAQEKGVMKVLLKP